MLEDIWVITNYKHEMNISTTVCHAELVYVAVIIYSRWKSITYSASCFKSQEPNICYWREGMLMATTFTNIRSQFNYFLDLKISFQYDLWYMYMCVYLTLVCYGNKTVCQIRHLDHGHVYTYVLPYFVIHSYT